MKVDTTDNIHKKVGQICPGIMYYFAGCFHCTYTYLDGVDVVLRAELSDADHIAQMVDKLTTGSFRDAVTGFAAALVVEIGVQSGFSGPN